MRLLAREDVDRLLGNWAALNHDIASLPMESVKQLLVEAINRRARPEILLRIHARYNKLRALDERTMILQWKVPWEEHCGYGK